MTLITRCGQTAARAAEDAMNGPQITVVGNVAWPPRLRTLASGTVVADFRIGTTPSRFDKVTDAWVDQETLWFNVTCWRTLAENAALSFNKGDRVMVTGSMSTRSWKTKEGEDRTSLEIDATSVGMDLTRGPVIQKRIERTPAAAEGPFAADAEAHVDPTTGESAPEIPNQVAA
jgi:single-strand DNA-binding protein